MLVGRNQGRAHGRLPCGRKMHGVSTSNDNWILIPLRDLGLETPRDIGYRVSRRQVGSHAVSSEYRFLPFSWTSLVGPRVGIGDDAKIEEDPVRILA